MKPRFFRPGFLFFSVLFWLSLSRPGILPAEDSFPSGENPAAFESGDFGFGEPEGGFGLQTSPGFNLTIGGEAAAELTAFHDEFDSAESIGEIRPGDIFSGTLNFEASGSSGEAVIRLKLFPAFDDSPPVVLDEAYLRAFFGPVTVEGGLRKITWGKADSFGPLDVVNPLDYTDLTKLSDPQSVKIARPMIHAAWSLGAFSKLEAVFVPWFKGHEFASSGRWTPNQVNDLLGGLDRVINGALAATSGFPNAGDFSAALAGIKADISGAVESGAIYPDTATLEYAQGGTRFTTTLGSSDLGIQYYFGRLPRPALGGFNHVLFFTPSGNPPVPEDLHPEAIIPEVRYNYYHQIAADFARVVAGFNLRAEAGANITGDSDGTDGAVYNSALVWSLGFDRKLFLGINLNLQGTGLVRLFHDKINDNPFDCEAGKDLSSTRITGILSRSFFRDELELKASVLWGIEDRDFLVMPGLVWTRNDLSVEFLTGFFGGDEQGELGQYGDNNYFRLVLSYSF